jgi:hypothetical protein
MRHPRTPGALLAFALALTACGRAPGGDAARDTSAVSPSGVPTRPRTAMTAMPMLPKLQAHLDSVASHPAMLRSGMAGHQAEVKAVVDAMHADMMSVGMHSDAAYEALADSVVKESAELGTASGPDFEQRVMHHVDQMRRLAAVYQSKVAAM